MKLNLKNRITSIAQSDALFIGVLLAISGTFLFSLKPILIKQAYALSLSSEQLITLRMIIAAPFYFAVFLFMWFRKPERRIAIKRKLPAIAGLGVLGYFIASYLDLLGLQYITAQLERVVLFCFPTIVVLLSKFLLKKPLPNNIWLLLGMSYSGILVIFGHDLVTLGADVIQGVSLVFFSAFAFAFYIIYSKPLMVDTGSQVFTSIAMLAASAVIFVWAFGRLPTDALMVSTEAYLLATLLAIFCTFIPSLLIAAAIQRIGPELTSIVGTCGPAITSILAVFLLGEAFTIYHFVGLLLVMSAIGLMLKTNHA